MCDYSLQAIKSRPARVGERLQTNRFPTGSGGFVSPEDGPETAICVLPGTELAFDEDVAKYMFAEKVGPEATWRVARFRQVDTDQRYAHHDALEFADGRIVKLTLLAGGQWATVLQLPAAPKTAEEAKAQERMAISG